MFPTERRPIRRLARVRRPSSAYCFSVLHLRCSGFIIRSQGQQGEGLLDSDSLSQRSKCSSGVAAGRFERSKRLPSASTKEGLFRCIAQWLDWAWPGEPRQGAHRRQNLNPGSEMWDLHPSDQQEPVQQTLRVAEKRHQARRGKQAVAQGRNAALCCPTVSLPFPLGREQCAPVASHSPAQPPTHQVSAGPSGVRQPCHVAPCRARGFANCAPATGGRNDHRGLGSVCLHSSCNCPMHEQ